jgi:hypothetical protein
MAKAPPKKPNPFAKKPPAKGAAKTTVCPKCGFKVPV